MGTPVVLTVDDDTDVLAAIQRDLEEHFPSPDYQVVAAASGEEALSVVDRLKLRDRHLALIVADQRMPGLSGVEVIVGAKRAFPDLRSALLTAYADTGAAIDAINRAGVDRYLVKPWDPPERELYPALDDLMDDWRAHFKPPPEGRVRIIGSRWSREAYELRTFLASNRVPYQLLDIEADPEAADLLARANCDPTVLPVVLPPRGRPLIRPDLAGLMDAVGIASRPARRSYDLVIVGGGPAGLAAAVYAGSEGLDTVVVEARAAGGQASASAAIENYLGFPKGLTGADLARRAVDQAAKFHAEIVHADAAALQVVDGQYRTLVLADGTELTTEALLVASGATWRTLGVPGDERLTGRGVYYGASVLEDDSYAGEHVVVVGGGNSAGQAVVSLAARAAKVTLLIRGGRLGASMSAYLVDRICALENVEVRTISRITECHGSDHLEAVSVFNTVSRVTDRIETSHVFAFIGATPNTEWLDGTVACDERGFVRTGPDLLVDGRSPQGWPLERDPFVFETSVPGVFAAGDVRATSVKRVATAVGEGAIVVSLVHEHLADRR